MPNFDAQIRRTPLDISGLILACSVDDLVLSGTDVIEMINKAPAYNISSINPRFNNPIQNTPVNRPSVVNVGGQDYVRFDRSNSNYLNLLRNSGTWSGINRYTVAIVGSIGADSSNYQSILALPNLKIYRRNVSGNKAYEYNSTPIPGSGDVVDGVNIISFNGTSGGEWYENGSLDYSGACDDITISGDGAIGSEIAPGNYLDFDLIGIYLWKRVLTPYELDFLFSVIDPLTDHSSIDWASITLRVWRDNTSNPPRINPLIGADHRYYHVAVPTGTQRFIQIAASVDGIVKPDSDLGGELFIGDWVERPSGNIPYIWQDTGYSSVFNIRLEDEGHYTYQIFRQSGGSIIVHFDVEET